MAAHGARIAFLARVSLAAVAARRPAALAFNRAALALAKRLGPQRLPLADMQLSDSRNADAVSVAVCAGPFDQSHAHQDQGGFTFWAKKGFQAVTAAISSLT